LSVASTENEADIQRYKYLITEMKGRVYKFCEERSLNHAGFQLPPLVFVEGFLLYTAPDKREDRLVSLSQSIGEVCLDFGYVFDHKTSVRSRLELMGELVFLKLDCRVVSSHMVGDIVIL